VLTYVNARSRFVAAAGTLGWHHLAYPIEDLGPGGEPLSIDVAISPSSSPADRVLVISSGLHGVEGHFGSAAQLAWLDRLRGGPPMTRSVRCVLVHALNPYGYAWSRRCDSQNVDLNRAFRWDGMSEPTGDGLYARIDGLLNPQRPPSGPDGFGIRVRWAAVRMGTAALRRAIAAGQRKFPRGLFFAGTEVTPLQRLLEEHLRSWVGRAQTVVHLDLHTGLGRSGEHGLIVDYPIDAAVRTSMTSLVAPTPVSESLMDGSSYAAIGSLGQWCVAQRIAPAYLFAFAEFGTYGPVTVLSALRAENQAHHWGQPAAPATARAKERLRERFYPAAPSWRSQAVGDGVALIERVCERLATVREILS
jgi:hypothetical protein